MISKFGDVPDDLGGRADCSAFQVEFGPQPVCDRFDHLGPPRVPPSVRHDRDLPSILTGDDRDGDIRGQLADVFHLQLDRRVEFFARFCRLFQAGSFTARNGTTAFGYPRERMFLSSGPLSPWLSATGAVLKRRAVVHRVKDIVALSFPPLCAFENGSVGLPRPGKSALPERCHTRRVIQPVSSLAGAANAESPQTPLGRRHGGPMSRYNVTNL
ncbi:hypothetical protein Bra1253DRAFT_07083 [Bradyrhizobium sp. WSM1253]|nr:hypothetical protein Bra1253DRAFT_07083 [Bradyrhizobium sp. WSM1253]